LTPKGRLEKRTSPALAEIDRRRVAAADDDRHAFAGSRLVRARRDGGKRAGATRLRHDAQGAPQRLLRLGDRLVGYKYRAWRIFLCDREYKFADAAWRQRIRREPAGFRVDGAPGLERFRQRRRRRRLDAD